MGCSPEDGTSASTDVCSTAKGDTLKNGLTATFIIDEGNGDFKIYEPIFFRDAGAKAGTLSIYCENRDKTGLHHIRLFGQKSGRLLAEVTDGKITTMATN